MFEFLNECFSDHNERNRSIQIDKNFITQTFRMYNFIFGRTVRNQLAVCVTTWSMLANGASLVKRPESLDGPKLNQHGFQNKKNHRSPGKVERRKSSIPS